MSEPDKLHGTALVIDMRHVLHSAQLAQAEGEGEEAFVLRLDTTADGATQVVGESTAPAGPGGQPAWQRPQQTFVTDRRAAPAWAAPPRR